MKRILVAVAGLFISGCAASTPSAPVVTSGKVVKITATHNYYNVMVENDGEIITKKFYYPNITFIADVKAGEPMRLEKNGDKDVIHLHDVHTDIIITTEGK
jgi:hypothetical protein